MRMFSASRVPAGTWQTSSPRECRRCGLKPCVGCARVALLDAEMVCAQRAALIDPQAPNPSVETLLHAFLPQKFVDHTHATAILSLIDQADSEALCQEAFGNRLGFVPYIMPGFALAKKAADVFEKNPAVEGLILDKHGIFTVGSDAREAYERMIEFVTLAEDRLRKKGNAKLVSVRLPDRIASLPDVAPIVRGACALRDAFGEGAHKRQIVDFRTSDTILNYVNGKEVARYARAGLITPDHVIRTGPWPLIVPAPEAGRLDDFKNAVQRAARTSRTTILRILRAKRPAPRAPQCAIPFLASCWCRASA